MHSKIVDMTFIIDPCLSLISETESTNRMEINDGMANKTKKEISEKIIEKHNGTNMSIAINKYVFGNVTFFIYFVAFFASSISFICFYIKMVI